MAEAKKGGFHALEQRIHQIEEEDAKKEASATAPEEKTESARAEPPKRGAPRK